MNKQLKTFKYMFFLINQIFVNALKTLKPFYQMPLVNAKDDTRNRQIDTQQNTINGDGLSIKSF
jgi:hypothetical protein